MIVEFTRNGKQKRMNPKVARVLERKGHIRIMDVGVETSVVEKIDTEEGTDLESMSLDELRAAAAEKGLTVHHRAGEEKIRAELRALMQ